MALNEFLREGFTRVIETGVAVGYALRDLLFGAPASTPVGEPYTPSVSGGQCFNLPYTLNFDFTYTQPNGSVINQQLGVGWSNARYGGFRRVDDAAGFQFFVDTIAANGAVTVLSTQRRNAGEGYYNLSVIPKLTADLGTDNCGDLPNPNTPPSTGESGLADSFPPNLSGGGSNPPTVISEGVAPIAVSGAFAVALAALRAAANIAQIAAAIADVLKAIKDLLDNKDKKDNKDDTDIIQKDLGLIQTDGFLRLYPSTGSGKYSAIYLDLQVKELQPNLGKYFGIKSPNRYRFNEIGYISFVSPTFGIMRTESIQFNRCSLEVPKGAIGFFYHFGLNTSTKVNASVFYEQKKSEVAP